MPSVLSSVSSDVLEGLPDLSRLSSFGGCFSAEAQVDQSIRVESGRQPAARDTDASHYKAIYCPVAHGVHAERSGCTVTSEQSGSTRTLIDVPTSVRPLWALIPADFDVGGGVSSDQPAASLEA